MISLREMKLFTAGPVACYPEVLEEMKHQMFSHRSVEYKQLHRETIERIQRFLETSEEVFLFSSSGTGIMEASIRNCVNKKVLCCINGDFGKRYCKVAEANGKIVEKLEAELGKPINADLLDEKLKRSPDVEAVSITFNETSVGLLNPLPKLAEIVKNHGKILFVDAVSAMGGVEMQIDRWGLDITFASSHKCFGLPPGLAIAAVSNKALKKSDCIVNKGIYFDFKLFQKYQQKAETPMTPPIPQIFGLRKILEIIDQNGGKQIHFNHYLKVNNLIKEQIKKFGLSLFPQEEYASPTISCINAPSTPSTSEIYKRMREKGYELAKGHGTLQNKTFRIGNMGHISLQEVDRMLSTLEIIISK